MDFYNGVKAMSKKVYKCLNGCKIKLKNKQLLQNDKGEYYFGYPKMNYCRHCGALMPKTLKKIKTFVKIGMLHEKLEVPIRLLYKSEYSSAVSKSIVILENVLREKSGLDLYGGELVSKSLSFEFDKDTGNITSFPLIQINDLNTVTRRNEQDGVKMMLLGFFNGPRNMYQHNDIQVSVDIVIALLLQISFFLKLLDQQSLTDLGTVIKSKLFLEEVLENMPRKKDRKKLLKILQNKFL